jgi:hypothetical protein
MPLLTFSALCAIQSVIIVILPSLAQTFAFANAARRRYTGFVTQGRLHDGVFFIIIGGLFITFAGWFGHEMAGKVDYDEPASPAGIRA